MKIEDMDADLKAVESFDELVARSGYWHRRLAASKDPEALSEEFDNVMAKHSRRVLSVLRAG